MQSCCLFAFDLQPEDTQVLVGTVLAYFYLRQIWLSLVKCERGIYSSSLPKRSVSLPVRAVGTVPGPSARGNAVCSVASWKVWVCPGKREGPAALTPQPGGFGRVLFVLIRDALKSPRLHFPFVERCGAASPGLTWDVCAAVPLPAGVLDGRGGGRVTASPRIRKMIPLGGFPWASGGFRVS